ncbi:Hypp3455 [Branchiostoma lanceolatum]|uniref:Hypp3455 protein n=1 Tax=Branchiostoma lanceolatum TaxID=7740 RepID=A0A8K0A0C3_BRALA|nr:Hypp3455 [Branchiostoma lanceolatum]
MVRHPTEHFFEKPPQVGHGVLLGRPLHPRLPGPRPTPDGPCSLARRARSALRGNRSRAGRGAHSPRRHPPRRPVPSPMEPAGGAKSTDDPVFSPRRGLARAAPAPSAPSRTRWPQPPSATGSGRVA